MNVRRQIIMLVTTVVIIVGTFAWTLASSQPAGARPRPPGRDLDRPVPGQGHRHVRARHRGRHHPPARRRPRHRRTRGAAAGQHDRRRPPRCEGAREGGGAGRPDRRAPVPTRAADLPVGHGARARVDHHNCAGRDDHDGTRGDHHRAERDDLHDHQWQRRRDQRQRCGARTVPTTPIAAVRPAQETPTTVVPAPPAAPPTGTPVPGDTTPTTAPAVATRSRARRARTCSRRPPRTSRARP